jgi:hypothetical protein
MHRNVAQAGLARNCGIGLHCESIISPLPYTNGIILN